MPLGVLPFLLTLQSYHLHRLLLLHRTNHSKGWWPPFNKSPLHSLNLKGTDPIAISTLVCNEGGFILSSGAINVWIFPEDPSMNDKSSCLVVLSTNTSIYGNGKSSFGRALLRSRKSTHTLMRPSLLGTSTMLATHLGYLVTIKNLAFICFSTSSFTLSAQSDLI